MSEEEKNSVSESHGVTISREEFFDNADAALGIKRTTISHRVVVFDEPTRKAQDHEPRDDRGRPVFDPTIIPNDADPELVGKSPDEMADILDRREGEDGSTEAIMGIHRKQHAGGGGGNRLKFKIVDGVIVEQVQQMGAKASGSGGGSGRVRRDKKPNGTGGPPRIESEPRDERRTLRMTETTLAELYEIERETGINLPGLVAAIAILRKRPDATARFAVQAILKAAPLTG